MGVFHGKYRKSVQNFNNRGYSGRKWSTQRTTTTEDRSGQNLNYHPITATMSPAMAILFILLAVSLFSRSARAFSSSLLPHSQRYDHFGCFAVQAAQSEAPHAHPLAPDEAIFDDDDGLELQRGTPEGFYIIQQTEIPAHGFNMTFAREVLGEDQMERVGLSATNCTVAAALMLLYPDKYGSLSKSRKALRKGYILRISRGEDGTLDRSKCIRARVNDRIYPMDVLAEQSRLGNTFYPRDEEPPFSLPVIYEDDFFAIVNKPAGVNVNSHRKSGIGHMCVRAASPYVLTPPAFGTRGVIRRPSPVHRLDKPTSGLLLVAKTKPAMVELTRQLKYRIVKKTYTAIVNGVPKEFEDRSITRKQAHDLGVDVGPFDDTTDVGEDVKWQHISEVLTNKSKQTQEAVTVWRPITTVDCPKAKDGKLTLVQLKPKSGRYHQLRKHMAWACERPLVGDKTYSGNVEMRHQFLDDGLYLCSNAISLEHPYYNTEAGRREWDALDETDPRKYANGMLRLSEKRNDDGLKKVLVHAEIELPGQFQQLVDAAPSLTAKQEPMASKKELLPASTPSAATAATAAAYLVGLLSSPAIASSADIVRGKEIFDNNCAGCHIGGVNLVKPEKNLQREALARFVSSDLSQAEIQQWVQQSGQHKRIVFFKMPDGKMKETDWADVTTYVLDQALNDKW